MLGLVATTGTMMAQANPWNGSWKEDPATHTYDGPTASVTVDANGYTMTRGGVATKTVCDGKPQKTDDTMTACTKSATGYSIVVTKDGKTVRKAAVSLSADGKTRTVKSEVWPTDGAMYTVTSVSTRVSGGPGFAGDWKEVKTGSSDDHGVLTIAVKGDSVDFKETDTPKPITCKLDGTPTKVGDTTMSVKLADPHTLKVTYSSDGKVRRNNTFVLSADAKSITETDVTPAPAVSTMSVVLKKM